MLNRLWSFLKAEENQKLLGWIGGGLVVTVTGFWAVFKMGREPLAQDSARDRRRWGEKTRVVPKYHADPVKRAAENKRKREDRVRKKAEATKARWRSICT